MKKIVLIVFLMGSFSQIFCQTSVLGIGREWWYSQSESFIDTTKEGYVYYTISKDTSLDNKEYKLLLEEKYNSKRKLTGQNKYFLKNDSGVVFYRTIVDTSWYYMFHFSPVKNAVFTAKIRKGVIFKADTLVSLTVTGITLSTISGIGVSKYTVDFCDKKYTLYSNELITSIGGQSLLLNTITYKDVFDLYVSGPIRCARMNNILLKFEHNNACDTAIFIIPTYTGVYGFSGDSFDVFDVFPNPSNGRFELNIKSDIAPLKIEIINNQGVKIENYTIERDSKNIKIDIFQTGLYFVKIKTQNGIYIRKILKL